MDLKFALRSLRRNPAFALLAITILALGIGANTAIFTVIHAVILRPLAYKNPDRIVAIGSTYKHEGGYGRLSGPDFLDYRKQNTAFESMAAYGADATSVVINSTAEFAGMCGVSQGFLETMGVEPVQGHGFGPNDWNREIGDVALVSEGFWARHFGSEQFVPGEKLKAFDTSIEIIGLLPSTFHFPDAVATEIWIPIAVDASERSAHNYWVVGRLKSGISVEQAQAQLTGIADRLAKAYPASNKDMDVHVTPLRDYNVRNVKTSLYILLGAVLLVLIIACANVANLLLARGSGRLRELAIRTALGAAQSRIVRQLLIESSLLAFAGCIGGILIAAAALPALLALSPKYVPRLEQVRIDLPVLGFCVAAGVVATLLFGLAPALSASRVDPNDSLRIGGSRGIFGGAAGALRQLFVTAEIAVCVVLVVAAGLLLKSFAAITSVDLGFRPEKLLLAEMGVADANSHNRRHLYETFLRPLLARLAASRQVQAAAIISVPPGNLSARSTGQYIVSRESMQHFRIGGPEAGFLVISPAYFRAMGIPLLTGRSFSERDDSNGPLVAIISESLARRSFPRKDPVGQAILCGWDENSQKWMTIVGVVRDVRVDTPNQPPDAEIYMPYLQHRIGEVNVLVKDGRNPAQLAGMFRSYVRELNPEVPVKFSTMQARLSSAVAAPRFSSILISIFAALALVLAIIGIYGVMAYSVGRRTAEIGLRLALGADRRQVLRMVLRQGLKLTFIGLLIGAAGAVAATRVLKSQLFGISTSDPATYVFTFALLAAAGALASWLPAWRASRTEPLEALRQE